MPDTGMCAAGGRPHQITDHDGREIGGLICARHFDALGRLLGQVQDEVAALSAMPSLQINYGSAGGSSGGGAPAFTKAPALLGPIMLTDPRTSTWGRRLPGPYCRACDHLSCIERRGADEDTDAGSTNAVNPLAVLTEYADRVREERQLTPPVREHRYRNPFLAGPSHHGDCGHSSCADLWITGQTFEPPTVRSERQLLTRNLEWVARQPWVGELWTAVRELVNRLQRVNGTAPPEAEGRCPAITDGHECGGPLHPAKPKYTSSEETWTGHAHDALVCLACGTRWEGPAALARLALMVAAQRNDSGRTFAR